MSGLHREGSRSLSIVFIFLMAVNLTFLRYGVDSIVQWCFIGISVGFFVFLLQFFRNPRRYVTQNDSVILCPADGKVVVIEEALENEFFKTPRLMISIFMSPLNVHSNHHPISGKIVYKQYHPGKYLVAWHPKSSTENERTTLVYRNDKVEILTRQIAGALARRIINYASEGDEVIQGGEMGFIKFGSRVDIFLPIGTKCAVELGQKVRSRIDVLAHL